MHQNDEFAHTETDGAETVIRCLLYYRFQRKRRTIQAICHSICSRHSVPLKLFKYPYSFSKGSLTVASNSPNSSNASLAHRTQPHEWLHRKKWEVSRCEYRCWRRYSGYLSRDRSGFCSAVFAPMIPIQALYQYSCGHSTLSRGITIHQRMHDMSFVIAAPATTKLCSSITNSCSRELKARRFTTVNTQPGPRKKCHLQSSRHHRWTNCSAPWLFYPNIPFLSVQKFRSTLCYKQSLRQAWCEKNALNSA